MIEKNTGVDYRNHDTCRAGAESPSGLHVGAANRIEEIPLVSACALRKSARLIARIVGHEQGLIDVVGLRELDVGLLCDSCGDRLHLFNAVTPNERHHTGAVVHGAKERRRFTDDRAQTINLAWCEWAARSRCVRYRRILVLNDQPIRRW